LVFAVLSALGATLLSPNILPRIGIMTVSLSNPIAAVRETTVLEIAILRGLAIGTALFFASCYAAWGAIAHTRVGKWLNSNPDGNVLSQQGLASKIFPLMLACCVLTFWYILAGRRLLTPAHQLLIQREDGVLEDAQFFLILAASCLAVLALRRRHFASLARRNTLIVIAVLFFFIAGEEISWGQRLLGYATPPAVGAVNVQNEFNIHNLRGYFFDHMGFVIVLGYGAGLPLLARLSPFWMTVMGRLGLILPSWGLALGFLGSSFFYHNIFWKVFPGTTDVLVGQFRQNLVYLACLLLLVEYEYGWIAGPSVASQRRSVAGDDVTKMLEGESVNS
jgi:hypothetical protein